MMHSRACIGTHRATVDRNDGAIMLMQRASGPCIRIAPKRGASGLRFSDGPRKFFASPCRSAAGRFVVSNSETVPRAGGRGSPQPGSFPMRFMYIVTSPQPNRRPDAGADGGHAQAGRPRDQGRPHARQRRADAGPTGAQVQDRGRQAQRRSTARSWRPRRLIGGYAIFELRDKEEAVARPRSSSCSSTRSTCRAGRGPARCARLPRRRGNACQVEARVAS